MTDETINALVATRNRLTNRRDEMIDMDAVDMIDAILRDVPPGQRNDVDLLLGRPTAVLPPRAALQAACQENGVKAQWYSVEMQAHGASIEDSPKDWRDLRGDCTL